MSTARKLKAHDPNFTAARLEPGRKWIAIKNLEAPDELQPRAGIEFMTPDELIRSLGAGGMTPDEIQASLKKNA